MAEFDLDKICTEYFDKNLAQYGALQELNLSRVKVKARNEKWEAFEPSEETQSTGQAHFTRTERSGVEMTNDLTACNVYRPKINVTLYNGRVKGTNKRIGIKFQGQAKALFGDGMEIDPAKYSSEPEMCALTLTTTTSKDMPATGATASSATVSTYQQRFSGQFSCEVVLSGMVIFVLQGEETFQQTIKEIMLGRNIRTEGDKVVFPMTGSLVARKDSKQATSWD